MQRRRDRKAAEAEKAKVSANGSTGCEKGNSEVVAANRESVDFDDMPSPDIHIEWPLLFTPLYVYTHIFLYKTRSFKPRYLPLW